MLAYLYSGIKIFY